MYSVLTTLGFRKVAVEFFKNFIQLGIAITVSLKALDPVYTVHYVQFSNCFNTLVFHLSYPRLITVPLFFFSVQQSISRILILQITTPIRFYYPSFLYFFSSHLSERRMLWRKCVACAARIRAMNRNNFLYHHRHRHRQQT